MTTLHLHIFIIVISHFTALIDCGNENMKASQASVFNFSFKFQINKRGKIQ